MSLFKHKKNHTQLMSLKAVIVGLSLLFSGGNIVHAAEIAKEAVSTESTTPTESQSVADASSESKVNINTATVEEIKAGLKGIGTKKAEAIVSYREKHGVFTSIEQLKEVPGIGPTLLEKNMAELTL